MFPLRPIFSVAFWCTPRITSPTPIKAGIKNGTSLAASGASVTAKTTGSINSARTTKVTPVGISSREPRNPFHC